MSFWIAKRLDVHTSNDPNFWVRRLTAYLEPDLDEEADLSDVLNDALRRYRDGSEHA